MMRWFRVNLPSKGKSTTSESESEREIEMKRDDELLRDACGGAFLMHPCENCQGIADIERIFAKTVYTYKSVNDLGSCENMRK